MKKFLVLLLMGVSTLALSDTNDLRFTNTQTLGRAIYEFIETYEPFFEISESELNAIPQPGENDSIQTRKELDTLLVLQGNRTQNQIDRAKNQRPFCNFEMPGFEFGVYPKIDAIIQRAFVDLNYHVYLAKIHFDRVRPSFLEEKVKTALPNPPHPAYPSGHATNSRMLALLLAEFFPERRAQFIEYSNDVARHREIVGVHYKSDSSAGQQLAQIYFDKFKETDLYKELSSEDDMTEANGFDFSYKQCSDYMGRYFTSFDRPSGNSARATRALSPM